MFWESYPSEWSDRIQPENSQKVLGPESWTQIPEAEMNDKSKINYLMRQITGIPEDFPDAIRTYAFAMIEKFWRASIMEFETIKTKDASGNEIVYQRINLRWIHLDLAKHKSTPEIQITFWPEWTANMQVNPYDHFTDFYLLGKWLTKDEVLAEADLQLSTLNSWNTYELPATSRLTKKNYSE